MDWLNDSHLLGNQVSGEALSDWRNKGITYQSSLQVDKLRLSCFLLVNIILMNGCRKLRQVLPSIRLSRYDEISRGILWILSEDERCKEVEHFLRYLIHCGCISVAIGEPCVDWLVKEQEICLIKP